MGGARLHHELHHHQSLVKHELSTDYTACDAEYVLHGVRVLRPGKLGMDCIFARERPDCARFEIFADSDGSLRQHADDLFGIRRHVFRRNGLLRLHISVYGLPPADLGRLIFRPVQRDVHTARRKLHVCLYQQSHAGWIARRVL